MSLSKLIAVDDAASTKEIPLEQDEITIGKKQELVDVIIEGVPTVSRSHAKIFLMDGKYQVTDIGSSNGTYVNKRRLEAGEFCELHDGDRVDFAEAHYIYREPQEEPFEEEATFDEEGTVAMPVEEMKDMQADLEQNLMANAMQPDPAPQPVEEPAAAPQPEITGYDPMTGQPIYANAQPQQTQPQIISYDPMTGQPIYANAQPQQQAQPQITGYDPMTGQPIYANAPQAAPAMNETPKPAKKKTVKITAIIGGVAAAAAVIAIVVTVGTQLVLGKNGKILMATANTFKDIPIVEALNVEELLASEKCTMEVSGSAEGLEVSAVLSQDQKAKQISMAGDARYNGVGSDFAFYMDDTEIRLQAKDLLEPVLCYNYQETPTGYLAELMRDEGVDLSDMNRMLQQVMSQEDAQEAQKESMKIFYDQFQAMEFEKIDAETFEVNGKDRKCKGYTTEIDRYVLIDWVDAYEEWFTEYMGDYADTMKKYDMDYAELFDEMREELGDIDPYDLDIFVYKKQIAAVEMRSPRTKAAVVLEVQGGDYPLQNWEISTRGMDEKHQISQKGETNGKEEEIKWYVDREQIAELRYDHKTGDLEVGVKEDGTNLFYMRGSLLRNKNGFECSLDDVQVEGQAVDVKGTIKISNKAEIQKMDDAEQFDVGNATEAMWRDLIMESRLSSFM